MLSAEGAGRNRPFVKENKKWHLLPILILFLSCGLLLLASGTAVVPYIDTLS